MCDGEGAVGTGYGRSDTAGARRALLAALSDRIADLRELADIAQGHADSLEAECERLRRFAAFVATYGSERELVGSGVIEKAREALGNG